MSDLPQHEIDYHMNRRRILMSEIANEEKHLGIEKPAVYIPGPLHEWDEQMLSRHFKVVREERPPP